MSPYGMYVAFSGGKDSIVALDLVRRAKVIHTVHIHLTSVDFPELIYFVRRHYSDITWERPSKTMWQLIVEKMFPPTRKIRYCCEELKEGGGSGRLVVTGLRWQESNKRRKRRMIEMCQKDSSKIFLNPIIEWTHNEVWEYIHSRNLPYCELYDQGFKRLGCVGCPMSGKTRIKKFLRYPKYKDNYLRAFSAAAAAANRAALGIEFGGSNRLARLRWLDGDDMFRWWMNEDRCRTSEEQLVLFE
jgi:phosphoadenosine phosphosulfate reductase